MQIIIIIIIVITIKTTVIIAIIIICLGKTRINHIAPSKLYKYLSARLLVQVHISANISKTVFRLL